MTTAVLRVARLCKSFGGVHAIRDLTFEVQPGEVMGLIGPNGSGKSTTVNSLAGLFPVTSGEILLAGAHIQQLPEPERVELGLARTFQTASVFPEFTVRQQIRLGCEPTLKSPPLSSIFGIGRHEGEAEAIEARVQDLLEITGLAEVADQAVATISSAQQRFLMIATALTASPAPAATQAPLAAAPTAPA